MRFISSLSSRRILLRAALFFALGMWLGTPARAEDAFVRLNHSAPASVANARHLGRLDPTQTVRLAIALPLRNQAELDQTLEQLYTPGDPLYHQFLTPDRFTEQFGPTQADYDAVAAYFRGRGLTIAATHANRALLDVEGPAAAVEAALRVQFHHYQAQDGRSFYAANAAPALPASIAARVSGVLGMDNARQLYPQVRFKPQVWGAVPNVIGTGPLGGLAPKDIKTAYRIDQAVNPHTGIAPDGTGQTLALVELDGYSSSTIQTYESRFGLPNTPLVNVKVDGGPPGIGQGEVEVVLDIEMMVAVAPKATAIYVYEGPNSSTALVDILHRIATDNKASAVSTSWGVYEDEVNDGGAFFRSEASAFQQMAAQGQSMFAAAGDAGILDPNTLAVSALDPATQPFVTGVGGTTLSVVNPGVDEHYAGETVWNDFNNSGAGGGGVSTFWPIPSYQTAVNPAFNGGSSTMRNVPDVCLDSDPATGYDIYSAAAGGWVTAGGTSAAAPLWAAYTALVNQARGAPGRIGFINPAVYGIYTGTFSPLPAAPNDFHDITTGNNDFFGFFGIFYAGTGYDNASSLGSMVGDKLYTHMIEIPAQRAAPLPPKGVATVPGDTTTLVSWNASGSATQYAVYYKSSGSYQLAGITASLSFDVTGLTNGVLYSFAVAALNVGGASALSTPATATPAVVAITGGPSAAPASGSATITWMTNVRSGSSVSWGTSSTSLTHTTSSASLTRSHSLKITGLPTTHGTTIYYQISSKDEANITAASSIHTFVTP